MLQTDEPVTVIRQPAHQSDGIVHVNGFIVARNALVNVNAAGKDDLLQIELNGPRRGSSALFVDPATAVALLHQLDEAVTVCAACERAVVREDAAKCAGSGEWLCTDGCHPAACSSRSTCFYDDEYRDES